MLTPSPAVPPQRPIVVASTATPTQTITHLGDVQPSLRMAMSQGELVVDVDSPILLQGDVKLQFYKKEMTKGYAGQGAGGEPCWQGWLV